MSVMPSTVKFFAEVLPLMVMPPIALGDVTSRAAVVSITPGTSFR